VAFFLRLIGYFLRIIPDRIFYLFANMLGYLWFYIIRIRRRVATENVISALALTRDESERIVRSSMINLVVSFLEFISERPVVIDYANIEELNSLREKGAVIVTAHTANWDVLEQAASQNRIRLGIISRRSGFLPLQAFLDEIRKRRNEVVFAEDVHIGEMVRFLRSGGFLGVVIDQNMPPKRGRPALFFGKEVNTTFAPQILSLRADRVILPAFIRRVKDGQYEITFYRHHIVRDASDSEIRNSMNYLNSLLEEFIRRYPEQWLWVHRRFKPLKR